MIKVIKGMTSVLLIGLLPGCASYYTHYAVFPADNSAGEERQFRLTWQTADYPDWWIQDDKSTPMTLTSQCSERTWRLVDGSHAESKGQACADGIRACGNPQLDVWAQTGEPVQDDQACIRVNPSVGQATVTGIETALKLMVSCEPSLTTTKVGEELVNVDYLRASVVPYTVYSRKGVRGRLDSRPPELDDSVCDD